MNHEEEHYLPSSPPEEEAQRNNTMLMHDEKQEGILRFMNRDKDIDVWGVCMSDATRARTIRNVRAISISKTKMTRR